ncbi:mechanosensitive channel MscS [compost metagenome]
MGFGASTLDFSLRAWTYDFDRWIEIRSDLLARMYDALRAAGINIPFPQRDLHLRSVSDDASRALFAARPPAPDPSQPG